MLHNRLVSAQAVDNEEVQKLHTNLDWSSSIERC